MMSATPESRRLWGGLIESHQQPEKTSSNEHVLCFSLLKGGTFRHSRDLPACLHSAAPSGGAAQLSCRRRRLSCLGATVSRVLVCEAVMGTKGPLSCDNFYHASETDVELQRIRRRYTLTNQGSSPNHPAEVCRPLLLAGFLR